MTGIDIETLFAIPLVLVDDWYLAKVTARLFKHILRLRYHIDVQTFQCLSDFT